MPTYSHFVRKLRWSTHPASGKPLPPGLKSWLLDSGSLTSKLIAFSHGEFRVQVLRQVHEPASLGEAKAMGIARHQLCLVREVILMGHNQPWVFARSLLPLTSLKGRLRQLKYRGSKPLGAFLFSQPQLARGSIALSLISRHHAYVPDSLLDDQPVWGRRSIFYVDQKPLLVSEVFLPGFPGAKCNWLTCL